MQSLHPFLLSQACLAQASSLFAVCAAGGQRRGTGTSPRCARSSPEFPEEPFIYDNTAPDAPVVTGITDDTGIPGDGNTSDPTLVISGTAEANSLVTVYVDANNNSQVDAQEAVAGEQQLSGGATIFSITVILTQDAANNFVATATDAASNVSPAADVATITEDSQAPTDADRSPADGATGVGANAREDYVAIEKPFSTPSTAGLASVRAR